MALLGLLPANSKVTGSVKLLGRELRGVSQRELMDVRGGEIAVIFQEPMTALNPVYTIGFQIMEALRSHFDLNPAQVDRALAFLRKGLWVVPRTLPAESGPLRVEYRLGKRGAAFLASFERFRADIALQERQLGRAEVQELQSLSR